jgi:alkylation response protein AidB-like acyl-CoA dehydrogenase
MDLCAEMEIQQPYLTQYDSWGRRVDQLITCSAWKAQHVVAAEEGIIALGYDRTYGPQNRLYQFAKLYMYAPSSGLYSCPLAMTDGATRLCALLLNPSMTPSSVTSLSPEARAQMEEMYRRLTSRDGKTFITSGQWMTERGGGSDVGDGTRTVARQQPDGTYKLYGFKC